MFGWINDCTETLICEKFGKETWHKIKEKAGCTVDDGGFLRYQYYADADTVQLVVAASEVLNISVDDVLFAFGQYFVSYVQNNGYANVLKCLGSNLRDWLSNLNTLHDHLQASYPKGFVAPVFWSEDDPDFEGAILVHYHSRRGSLLVPLVDGLIKQVGVTNFNVEIEMEMLQMQDETEDTKHTTWRVTTADPDLVYKLRGDVDDEDELGRSMRNADEAFIEGEEQARELRVAELVERCFYHPTSELYHALSKEHIAVLMQTWNKEKINGKWCYEIWTMEEDESTWAGLMDLPPELNPDTIDPAKFGGKKPKTGAYPPDEEGEFLSFPPLVRITNSSTGQSQNLAVDLKRNLNLYDAVYQHGSVKQINRWGSELDAEIENGESEIHFVVWNQDSDDAYHTFLIGDLTTTTTKQLYNLVPKTFDPIDLVLQCVKADIVDDDEEEI